jgi:hypothetical protein
MDSTRRIANAILFALNRKMQFSKAGWDMAKKTIVKTEKYFWRISRSNNACEKDIHKCTRGRQKALILKPESGKSGK